LYTLKLKIETEVYSYIQAEKKPYLGRFKGSTAVYFRDLAGSRSYFWTPYQTHLQGSLIPRRVNALLDQ
jgi:hypothetical protein